MKLIVGLGNPEAKYDGTRHNVGFEIVDRLAAELGVSFSHTLKKAKTANAYIGGEKIIIAKPQTYMNLSGESVAPLSDYYKIAEEDILVVVDDVNLDVGRIRIRPGGSAGGHNGLKNIILNLATEEFPRLRVGVGGAKGELIGHVLGKIPLEERKILDETYKVAIEAIKTWVSDGTSEAMNRYNNTGKKDEDEKD